MSYRKVASLLIAVSVAGEPVAAQRAVRAWSVVPTVGVGGLQRNGPQLYGGLQIQRSYSPSLTGVLQTSLWMTLVACAHDVASESCHASGVNADLGVNFGTFFEESARPYLGAGIGVMTAGDVGLTVNSRLGVILGYHGTRTFHVELRLQRAFGALRATSGVLNVGVGFPR